MGLFSLLRRFLNTPSESPEKRVARAADYVTLANKLRSWDFNDWRRAHAYLRDAVRLDPNSVEAKLALAKLNLNAPAKMEMSGGAAVPMLDELITADTSNASYYFLRGIAHREDGADGSYERALADFAEVIRLDPTFDGGSESGPCAASSSAPSSSSGE